MSKLYHIVSKLYLGLGHPAPAAAAADKGQHGGEGEHHDNHHDGDQPGLREGGGRRRRVRSDEKHSLV